MPNVRYWAGARAATGIAEEEIAGETINQLLDGIVARHPAAEGLIARCAFLLDGVAVHDRGSAVAADATLEVLPPFAGGAQ